MAEPQPKKSSPGTEPSKLHYCEPIDIKEYELQKEEDIKVHLLHLLESIVSNENIAPADKKKRLKRVGCVCFSH